MYAFIICNLLSFVLSKEPLHKYLSRRNLSLILVSESPVFAGPFTIHDSCQQLIFSSLLLD